MVDAKMKERFAFVNPTLVSKARMGEATKENRSRVIAKRLMNASRAEPKVSFMTVISLLYIFLLDSHFNKKYFSFHWVLVALETRTMTAYYLDPMLHQPCDDLKDIVNMQVYKLQYLND